MQPGRVLLQLLSGGCPQLWSAGRLPRLLLPPPPASLPGTGA